MMNDAFIAPTPPSEAQTASVVGVVAMEQKHSRATIVPMDVSSVQRIVAGQAITDLASAVKELVDNALDAGSKTINIRLFNQGLDIVEVSDDGCGIPDESRPFIAMKHATSKIRDFADIYSTDSLGFRGEALFCLANISGNLVVATRTADQVLGQKLEFTRDGYLRQESIFPVPRKIGTTVAVVRLFDALPVRRADLEKRIQAQRREVFLMVQGYAIHSLGVKFNLFDISNNGREELRLSTMHGTSKLEETISSVLGSAFLSGMSRISIALPVDDSESWSVEGLISKAPHLTARDGSGARNAQFFSINGRPVDLPKISRTISDSWRKIETTSKKKPACVLHFKLPKNTCDVNLAPNKRQVLLTDELKICEFVREGVNALWSSQRDGKFLSNELDIREGDVDAATFLDDLSPHGRKVKRRLGFYNDFRHVKLQHDSETSQLQGSKLPIRQSTLPPASVTPSRQIDVHGLSLDKHTDVESENSHAAENLHINPPMGGAPTDADRLLFVQVQDRFRRGEVPDEPQPFGILAPVTPQDVDASEPSPGKRSASELIHIRGSSHAGKGIISSEKQHHSGSSTGEKDKDCSEEQQVAPSKKRSITMHDYGFQSAKKSHLTEKSVKVHDVPVSPSSVSTLKGRPESRLNPDILGPNPETLNFVNGDRQGTFTLNDELTATETSPIEDEQRDMIQWDSFHGTNAVIEASRKARLCLRDYHMRQKEVRTDVTDDDVTTDVENFNVSHNEEIDSEQARSIITLAKKQFEDMEVIGQFNLGFILVKCRNHLWVLDQHACDEKYNFERLCANTVIHEQRLLAPIPLELSPSEEACIMENRDIFAQNGFRFQYDEDKPPRHRFSLTSLPHSGARDGRKAVQFGKDDVHALCAVLGSDGASYLPQDGGTGVDGSGIYGNNAVRRHAGLSQNGERVLSRLPKAVAMFANRACRGSVMIGTALSKKEMETIVKRLASVDHPWNCPHGRPTLKHVKDMLGTEATDTRRTLQYLVGPTLSTMAELTQPDEKEQHES